jgi:hypothetical protein
MNKVKSDYILLPAKPVIIFEVFLPKKEEYKNKLEEVLDDFLELERLKKISLVEKTIAIEKITNSDFDEKGFLASIREVISGYSLYEVNGRFGSTDGPVDERVWVIRFIIHDPQIEGAIREDLIVRSKDVLRYLITKRFAEEIGLEDEIWFVEYQSCWLQRWVNESYRK